MFDFGKSSKDSDPKKSSKDSPKKSSWENLSGKPFKDQSPVFWYIFLTFVLLWLWQDFSHHFAVETLPYSTFKDRLSRGEIVECKVRQDIITGRMRPLAQASEETYQDKSDRQDSDRLESDMFRTVRIEDPKLVEDLTAAQVIFSGDRPGFLSTFLVGWVLPIGLMVVIWVFISRRIGGAAGQSVFGFGRSKAKLIANEDTGVSFDDVAGCSEAKFELQEVVGFLKDPKEYELLGAKIPKGVLLVGPPGTGKTLMARAVAGEAKVPFFSISGSDFIEMFVGVGASRVRDMFTQAKSQTPCIVFIDELDAIGRQRGVNLGNVNDEREQTLNQLLVEMDGFEANIGVILLAATNRPDVLDRALMRPGRFDRQVVVDAPDIEGRTSILKVHSKGKPFEKEVDLDIIAKQTPGFSGADLANTLNEAALLAVRMKHKKISQKDIENAVEKVVAGPERKSRRLDEDDKRLVAYHESGHALVAAYCDHADPVHKITIVPRGHAALGFTMQLPEGDQFLKSRSQLTDQITGLLGGRAAEEMVLEEITTGAENDLDRATALAKQMVCIYGMSGTLGLVHYGHQQNGFLAPQGGHEKFDCSEETFKKIDEEVKKILDSAYSKAKTILEKHREQLERVAKELLIKETLNKDEFNELIKISA